MTKKKAKTAWEKALQPQDEPDQCTEYDPEICGVRYVVRRGVGSNVNEVNISYPTEEQARKSYVGHVAEVFAIRTTNYSELAKRREAAKAEEPAPVEEPPKKRRGRPPRSTISVPIRTPAAP